MKKKFLVLLLSTAVVASLLTGCGDTNNTDSSDVLSTESEDNNEIKKNDIMALTATDYIKEVNYEGVADFASISTVSDEEVKENIDVYLEYYQVYEHITEGVVAADSIVNINYAGTINDVTFDNGSAENVLLDIADNTFLDGFATGLIEHSVGETVSVEVVFPDDQEGSFTDSDGAIKNLAGQTAKFDITINYICGEAITTLEAMNDEYAYDLTGGYYNTLEELIEGTRHDIIHQNVSNLELEMWDKLVDEISIIEGQEDAVAELVNQEYEYELTYYTQMANYYEVELEELAKEQLGYEDLDSFTAFVQENAQYVVYQNLIVDYLAETNDLVLTDEQYAEQGASLATDYGYDSLEEFIADYEEIEVKEYIQYDIVSEFLIKANGYSHEH